MNLTKYVLDADGQPVPEEDLIRWADWMGTGDNKVIAREQVRRNVRVVTTFLGYDMTSDDGTLRLWDTMVYGGRFDGECIRYASKSEAVAGHQAMVNQVMAS